MPTRSACMQLTAHACKSQCMHAMHACTQILVHAMHARKSWCMHANYCACMQIVVHACTSCCMHACTSCCKHAAYLQHACSMHAYFGRVVLIHSCMKYDNNNDKTAQDNTNWAVDLFNKYKYFASDQWINSYCNDYQFTSTCMYLDPHRI